MAWLPKVRAQRLLRDVYTQASNPSTAYNRFYFRAVTLPAANDEVICQAIDGSGVLKLEVRVNSAGNLVVYDSAVSLLATRNGISSTRPSR